MTDFPHLQGTEFEEIAKWYSLTETARRMSVPYWIASNDRESIELRMVTALNDALGREKVRDVKIAKLELLLGLSLDWLDDVCTPGFEHASKEGTKFRATIESVLEASDDRA